MKNRAGYGAVLTYQAGWQDRSKFTAAPKKKQEMGRARALLPVLAAAARSGSLAQWECEFIASIEHQSRQRRWYPTAKQAALIQNIAKRVRK